MGFFWANVKANIEGAVANAKMSVYEEHLRDAYDDDEDDEEDEDEYCDEEDDDDEDEEENVCGGKIIRPFAGIREMMLGHSNNTSYFTPLFTDDKSSENKPIVSIRDNWKEILAVLQTEYNVSDVSIRTWINPLRVESLEENVMTLRFRDTGDGEDSRCKSAGFVQKKYSELLSKAIFDYMDIQYTVRII